MKKTCILGILFLVFTGCTVGRKMSFSNESVTPDYSTARTMAIAFQENREAVLSGKEKVTFVGHTASTGQIAYNMQTESGKPLAEDFSGSVVNSLNKLGIKAEQLVVPMGMSKDSVLLNYGKTGKERLLLFHINKWASSATPRFSTIRYDVAYGFELEVFDKDGNNLASAEAHDVVTKDEEHLATNLKYLHEMAGNVFREQIKALLNDPKVKAVLQ